MKIIFILILLVGCGRQGLDIRDAETLPRVENRVDAHLLSFVKDFEDEFNKTVWMDVRLKTELKDYSKGGTLEENVIGVCWKSLDGMQKLVEIKKEAFYKMTYYAKQQLLFHELGHCVLNKNHTDPENILSVFKEDGCKSSIMDVYAFSANEINLCYQPQINYYLDELTKI